MPNNNPYVLNDEEKHDAALRAEAIVEWANAIKKEAENMHTSVTYIKEKTEKIRFLTDLINYVLDRHLKEAEEEEKENDTL